MTLNEIAKEIGVVKYDAIHEDMLALYPLVALRWFITF